MRIQSINPATETVNQEFEIFPDKKVIDICKNAHKAFEKWKIVPLAERARFIKKLATLFTQKKNEYAKLMTIEMGKPISQSIAEIEKCAMATNYFADNAAKWLEDELVKTEAQKSFISHEPLGVILSIMPWNFPFWQLIRFAVPALLLGNVSILRHSNNVPLCALAIEEAFKQAEFPEHVFTTIITEHEVIKKITRGNHIQGLSLTGSVGAGREIGKLGGKYIKKFVLELGGSDAFVVFDDANLDAAAKAAADSRTLNSGQSCICAKRFIVTQNIAQAFTEKFVHYMKNKVVGDPMKESTDVGPLANKKQLELLQKQIQNSVEKGAKILAGGKKLFEQGYYFEPTVLTHIHKKMSVFKEEVFGPAAPIYVVKTEKQAVKVANDSNLGLGGSIWTQDLIKGERLAKEMQTGMVFVNGIVRSDPRLPFGGIKDSGIGRELSRYGLLEFSNTKTIVIT